MHVRRVRSAEDVEQLRVLRNQSKRWMTRFRRNISRKQQAEWWAAEPRRAWLLVTEKGEALAFAYVSRRRRKVRLEGGKLFTEPARNYVTVGVRHDQRGQGLGTLMFRHVRPCFAEIRVDNAASLRAAEKAGYRAMYENGHLVVMVGA